MTRILHLTDLHLLSDPDERLHGIPTRELLKEVLAQIHDSGETVDHLVVTGDHAHDELTETYDDVREILRPWLDRLWQVPGNHDDRATLRSVFPDRIAGEAADRIDFSFRAGGWLCLGVDTQVTGEVHGRIDRDRVGWIRRQVDNHRPQGAVLFMHHPPVTLGCAWLDRIGLEGKELLQDLFVEDPRIRLVCSGHVHHESSHRVGAADVVTTPSTGLQFSAVSDEPLFVQAPPGYRIVELNGEELSTRVVRLPEARYSPDQ